MNRVRSTVAATLVSTTVYAAVAIAAQAGQTGTTTGTTTTGTTTSVLAGKKFTPPLRGEAVVEYTAPVTKAMPGKNMVQTVIKVRNLSPAPIARLQITETWFDKAGGIVTSSRSAVNGLLQPNEIQTITIETPYNAKMNGNGYNFVHANGTVKPKKVQKLEGDTTAKAKEPAAKPAAARKR
jgi:hypothetical protein